MAQAPFVEARPPQCQLTPEEAMRCHEVLCESEWVHDLAGVDVILQRLHISPQFRGVEWQEELERMFIQPRSLDLNLLLYIVAREKEVHAPLCPVSCVCRCAVGRRSLGGDWQMSLGLGLT